MSTLTLVGSSTVGRHRPPPVSTWSRPRLLVVVMTVLAVVGASVAVLPLLERPTAMSTDVPVFPGRAPAEWGPGVTWRSPPLLDGARPVSVGTSRLAMVTAERRLVVVEASNGQGVWEAALPDGDIVSPPVLSRVAGHEVLVAHVGDSVWWWSVEDGRRHRIEVPAGSRLSTLGEVPLVAVGGRDVLVLSSADPGRVTVPQGALALAAHPDGRVTAAGPSGWWHLDGQGGIASQGPWETRSTVPATVVGYTGGAILLLRVEDPVAVEVHTDRSADVRFQFRAPVVIPGGKGSRVTWTPSPSGTWGVLGRTLVDLRSGRVEDLGAWSTRVVTVDRAYGHIAGQTVVTGPRIPRGVVAVGESVPDLVLPSGALVRGPGPSADGTPPPPSWEPETAPHLYLLPVRRTGS